MELKAVNPHWVTLTSTLESVGCLSLPNATNLEPGRQTTDSSGDASTGENSAVSNHASFVSTRFASLKPLLSKWIWAHRKYCDGFTEPEAGWWYHERTSVRFLAAAAWSLGGVALEEYSSIKKRDGRSYRGRCDLYLRVGSPLKDLMVEAKHRKPIISGRNAGERDILRGLQQAVRDVRACGDPTDRRVGVVFVMPKLARRRAETQPALVDQWFKNLRNLPSDGTAWIRHTRWREFDDGHGYLYPGIAMLLRVA